jgi:DNA-binding helix-hairpin-helix protein with protein kinase domain
MAYSHLFLLSSGQQIALGKELGRGGEGSVYEIHGLSDIAVKIYHQDRAGVRAGKIMAMTAAKLYTAAPNVAFPIEPLFGQGSRFVGFTMRWVGGHQPVHNLYSPTSGKSAFPNANFEFLARTALNIAFSIASVHRAGCVVGDINHSGILIANNATVTLIDCDSFQLNSSSKTFNCTVGVPEFTPPELQGKRLDQIVRTFNHDHFGLAVLIFNLLFIGRHPFAGRFLGRGDMPMETAIAQYRFAYSSRRGETRMEPPPGVPLVGDMPTEMADAFEIAFGPFGASVARPKADDCIQLIRRAEKQITQCARNSAHHYFSQSKGCPWCRMESTYPGFLAFVSNAIFTAPSATNLAQLIAAIRSVPNSGAAPNLMAMMQPFQGNPSPSVVAAGQRWISRYVAGIVSTLGSFELMQLPLPGPLAGLLMLAGGVLLAYRHSDAATSIKKAAGQARAAWQAIEDRWNQLSDKPFTTLRNEAEEAVRKLNGLPNDETRQLAELKSKQHESQLKLFLELYYITRQSFFLFTMPSGKSAYFACLGGRR